MTIGFFMPLPLAMMIPFMGIQSAVMAKQFGENFQFGKRRISAMSNDAFNKLTPKILMENSSSELREMIPSMKDSLRSMDEFQKFIIQEFLGMVRGLPAELLKFMGIDPRVFEEDYDAYVDSFNPKPGTFKDPRDDPNRPNTPFPDPTRPTAPQDWRFNADGTKSSLKQASEKNIELQAEQKNKWTKKQHELYDRYTLSGRAARAMMGQSPAGQIAAARRYGFRSIVTVNISQQKDLLKIRGSPGGMARYSAWLLENAEKKKYN